MKIKITWEIAKGEKTYSVSAKKIQNWFQKISPAIRELPQFADTVKTLGFRPASVNLLVCDDVIMRDYQKKFRKLDRTTDILSFPAIESVRPQDFAADKSLGDLIISLPAVVRGAKRRKPRSVPKEFQEVLIHGCLHLLGLDHVRTKKEARLMRAYQKQILKKIPGE